MQGAIEEEQLRRLLSSVKRPWLPDTLSADEVAALRGRGARLYAVAGYGGGDAGFRHADMGA